MSPKLRGSPGDPILNENHDEIRYGTLNEAKLTAWAFAIGEAPLDVRPGRIASHRGLLPDLPPPEPVYRVPLWRRLLSLFGAAAGRAEPAQAGRVVSAQIVHHPSATLPAGPDDATTRDSRAA